MDVEQYAWATEELVHSAKGSVGELEEELRRERKLILLFIPLADFDSSGAYRINSGTTGFICHADGAMEWHFSPKDAAFINFEKECRSASSTRRDYFVRLLSYAFAHGYDVAKADENGNGRSILYALPHGVLHTDAGAYRD